MNHKILIKNATLVNEGKSFFSDILIQNQRIEKIAQNIQIDGNCEEILADGLIAMPGVIDDQVHFREPGLTHKADIASESAAAILGGTTSFMEMPNTNPAAFTIDLLEQKYQRAADSSFANYSFFMGASNDNIDEIRKVDATKVCGLKIFMGSSTGNLLVDNEQTLDTIFKETPLLIATHCEEEAIIRANKELYKEANTPEMHPVIRNREACIASSEKAIAIAKKYNTRLHILHISTAEEVLLFEHNVPLEKKRITAEACVHHLWFQDTDYASFGNQIVCNPAIKKSTDREAVWKGLLENYIDIIATDHAPHTWEEKSQMYPACPSGVPLVQHSLLMMLEKVKSGVFSIEKMVEKMCHAPAICFKMEERGFLREGYMADIVLVNPSKSTLVNKDNIAYKCNWSPFEGKTFSNSIDYTILNGQIAQKMGVLNPNRNAQRLTFNG
jgi:dihydroorotase